jgi:hypothetical protein
LLIGVAILFLYIGAAYLGYALYRSNPDGVVLLFAPPPPGPIHRAPSFPFGFELVLMSAVLACAVAAVIAFFVRTLLRTTSARSIAAAFAKGMLVVAIACAPGLIIAEIVSRAVQP